MKLIEILHEKLEKLEAEAEAHRVKIKKIESNSNSEGLAVGLPSLRLNIPAAQVCTFDNASQRELQMPALHSTCTH